MESKKCTTSNWFFIIAPLYQLSGYCTTCKNHQVYTFQDIRPVELVLKPAISLKKSWGGYLPTVEQRTKGGIKY